jgi:hypothetical protein
VALALQQGVQALQQGVQAQLLGVQVQPLVLALVRVLVQELALGLVLEQE